MDSQKTILDADEELLDEFTENLVVLARMVNYNPRDAVHSCLVDWFGFAVGSPEYDRVLKRVAERDY